MVPHVWIFYWQFRLLYALTHISKTIIVSQQRNGQTVCSNKETHIFLTRLDRNPFTIDSRVFPASLQFCNQYTYSYLDQCFTCNYELMDIFEEGHVLSIIYETYLGLISHHLVHVSPQQRMLPIYSIQL